MLGKPIEKVLILEIQCLDAIAVIRLESNPPESKKPTGTSEVVKRFYIDNTINLSISSRISSSVIEGCKFI